MENCIFCKILHGKIPCNKVYEDNDFFAFLDRDPVKPGHTLLIPKKHIIWMQESEDKTIEDIFKLTKKMMLVFKKGLGCDYVQIGIYGEEIPHFHIHLIPRMFNDDLPKFTRTKYKDDKQKLEILEKITRAL